MLKFVRGYLFIYSTLLLQTSPLLNYTGLTYTLGVVSLSLLKNAHLSK